MNRLRGSDNVLMLQWVSNESETALINLSDKRTLRFQHVSSSYYTVRTSRCISCPK